MMLDSNFKFSYVKTLCNCLLFISLLSCKAQENRVSNFRELAIKMVDFLELKKEINHGDATKYKNGQYMFNLHGAFNNSKGTLKEGLYAFSTLSSHGRGYFVFVDGESFYILDISTKDGLKDSISYTLDYADRHKYCNDITQQIVNKLISVYYIFNKNPGNAIDVNCESGIQSTEDLP